MAVRHRTRPSLLTKAPEPTPVAVEPITPAPAQPPAKWAVASTRVGKRTVVAWLDQAAFVQFGVIAREEGKTIQALLVEAVNNVFASRGKPRYD